MPGYEAERFVGLTPTEKAELTCSICQDIFCSPVTAKCCLQTFCEDCINDWLKSNQTCPYDRKTLTPNELSKPPRAWMNMLGKLKLRCDFKDKGCKEVLLLENLSAHTVKCRYNTENQKKKCKKCLCEYPAKSSHDCIKALLELNKKATDEIEALKRSSNGKPAIVSPQITAQNLAQNMREQSLLREIRELKVEKDNFLKTIQDMSGSAEQKRKSGIFSSKIQSPSRPDSKPTMTCSSEVSEQEIFNFARKYLWSPDIPQNDLDKDKTNKVLSIVRGEIKEYNSAFVVCKNIVEKLNAEFGSRWHCIASHQKAIKSFYTYETGHLIKLKFGELFFEIYKTQFVSNFQRGFQESLPKIKKLQLNVPQLRQRFRSGKIKREIHILRTDMKQSMISDVKKVTFAAIEKSDTLTEISSELKTQLEKRYPGKWQCFIFAYFGVFGIQHTSGTFISFDVDSLTVALFQAIG